MGKVKVHAPNEGYAGTVGDIRFSNGVAEVDENHAAMGYFKRRGYGIGKKADPAAALPSDKVEPTRDGKPVDARDFATSVSFGSPLRDAAVDPEPTDFLAPTNAGKANPHGPKVVAPGIHDEGPAGIRPGDVHVDDTDKQAAEETKLAEAVLIDGQPATDRAVELDADSTMGPLGLSDPGSVAQGVEAAKDVAKANVGSATMPPRANKPAAKRRSAPRGPKSK